MVKTWWKVSFLFYLLMSYAGYLSQSLLKLILISSEPMIAKDGSLGCGLLLQGTPRKCVEVLHVALTLY